MNYCKKCGMKLKEGRSVCPRCKADQIQLIEAEHQAKEARRVQDSSHRKKVAIISAAIAVVLVAAIVVLVVFLTRPATIDLNDYVLVTFTEEDGEYTAEYSFDTTTFSSLYEGTLTFESESLYEEIIDMFGESLDMDAYAITYLFENCLSGSLSETEGLSEGDVITFTWDVDEDTIEEAFGINVSYSDIKFTVSDSSTEEASSAAAE